jgi:hypothetical protein
MLFSTKYPSYQDPLGEVHESHAHPLLYGLQKISEYAGDLFAALFVMTFAGMELVFIVALAVLVLKGLATWDVMPEVVVGATQYWQGLVAE